MIRIPATPAARRAQIHARAVQRLAEPRQMLQRASLQAADGASEVYVYDLIGDWGLSARDFQQALDSTTDTVRIRINSPGGDVTHGVAMFNAIKRARAAGKRVTTHVDGEAASMASYIMLAGERVVIAENATVMIHEPWAIAVGDEHAMRTMADALAMTRDSSLVPAYAQKSGKSVADIRSILAAETWLDADGALSEGFVDEIERTVAALSAAYIPTNPRPVPSQPAGTASLGASRQDLSRIGAAAATSFKPEGNIP